MYYEGGEAVKIVPYKFTWEIIYIIIKIKIIDTTHMMMMMMMMVHEVIMYELKWKNLGVKQQLKVLGFQVKSKTYYNVRLMASFFSSRKWVSPIVSTNKTSKYPALFFLWLHKSIHTHAQTNDKKSEV